MTGRKRKATKRAPKTTVQGLATVARGYFWHTGDKSGRGVRPDVWLLAEAPQWVVDMVRDAHVGLGFSRGPALPDDTRFAFVVEVLDALIADEDEERARDAACETDIENWKLLQWVASHLGRADYCDRAVEELGISPETDLIGRLGWGQRLEREEVFGSVLESLQARS